MERRLPLVPPLREAVVLVTSGGRVESRSTATWSLTQRVRFAIKNEPIETLTAISLALENDACYDSIPTMRSHYPNVKDGPMVCPWPNCNYARRLVNVRAMYVHAMLGHGDPTEFVTAFAHALWPYQMGESS